MKNDTEIWEELIVMSEGEPVIYCGINLWEHKWNSLGRQMITIPNLVFPKQQYERYVYEIVLSDKTIRFSAEEITASVWRFHVPASQ